MLGLRLRMAKEMGDAIVEYEDLYKKLLKYQIDFTSSVPDRLGPLTFGKIPSMHSWYWFILSWRCSNMIPVGTFKLMICVGMQKTFWARPMSNAHSVTCVSTTWSAGQGLELCSPSPIPFFLQHVALLQDHQTCSEGQGQRQGQLWEKATAPEP